MLSPLLSFSAILLSRAPPMLAGPRAPLERAALFNAVAAGVRWAVHVPQLQLGQMIVIFGPGQRGLTCTAAAKSAGAGQIIVTGLPTDAHKLRVALALGADEVLTAGEVDIPTAVADLTNGRMADVAVDVTAGATQPVLDAIRSVRSGGTVVLAGLKSGRVVHDLITDEIVMRSITIKGVFAVDTPAYAQAAVMVEHSSLPLELMHTHAFGLSDAALAIHTLAGREGNAPISVSLRP